MKKELKSTVYEKYDLDPGKPNQKKIQQNYDNTVVTAENFERQGFTDVAQNDAINVNKDLSEDNKAVLDNILTQIVDTQLVIPWGTINTNYLANTPLVRAVSDFISPKETFQGSLGRIKFLKSWKQYRIRGDETVTPANANSQTLTYKARLYDENDTLIITGPVLSSEAVADLEPFPFELTNTATVEDVTAAVIAGGGVPPLNDNYTGWSIEFIFESTGAGAIAGGSLTIDLFSEEPLTEGAQFKTLEYVKNESIGIIASPDTHAKRTGTSQLKGVMPAADDDLTLKFYVDNSIFFKPTILLIVPGGNNFNNDFLDASMVIVEFNSQHYGVGTVTITQFNGLGYGIEANGLIGDVNINGNTITNDSASQLDITGYIIIKFPNAVDTINEPRWTKQKK